MLNPWDIPAPDSAGAKIIPLHRGAQVAPARAGERHDSGAPLSPIRPTTVERKGMVRQPTFDELQRAVADFPDLYHAFREPEVPPPSFAHQAVTIFCLAAAAWAAVYFAVQMLRGAL